MFDNLSVTSNRLLQIVDRLSARLNSFLLFVFRGVMGLGGRKSTNSLFSIVHYEHHDNHLKNRSHLHDPPTIGQVKVS